MMYQNSIYGIINQNYVQEQLQIQRAQQYHNDQMMKSFDCAKKLDDFMKSIDKVAPEYQQVVLGECCVVVGNYMRQHGML